ncbi:MAG TPA: hypothetical protein VMA31_14180 [Bryobacteraceae bacterium]|nr:hypothetical protein [Bryobacteraceae bacterium]
MPRLMKDLAGAEPVNGAGAPAGPPATLPAGSELRITVPKLRHPSDTIEVYWSEIQVNGQLYRVPRRALDTALAV